MFRFIGRIVVFLFLLGVLLAAFAPSILSTHFGKYAVFRLLQNMTGYQIKVEELKCHWTKDQTAKIVDVLDKRGRLVFRTDFMTSSASLWQILFYHDVGQLKMAAPFFLIDPPVVLGGIALKQASLLPTFTLIPSFHLLGDIAFTQGSAQFASPGIDPILIKEIELTASLMPKQIKLQTSGTTDTGGFHLQLLGLPKTNKIEAHATFDHFPLAAADQIVTLFYPAMKGVIKETLGESLSGELRVNNIKNNLQLYINASSDRFSAHLDTHLAQNALVLSSPAIFQFQIPEKVLHHFTALSVKKAVDLEIKIDELSLPLYDDKNFTLQGTLKSTGAIFDQWTLEPFALYVGRKQDDWGVKIDSPQIQLNGSFVLPFDSTPLSFTAEAFLPKNTKIDISAQSLKSIVLNIHGDLGSGKLKGAFDPIKKTVSLTDPAVLILNLEEVPIQIDLQPCTINFYKEEGSFKGKVKTPPFELNTAHIDPVAGYFTGDLKTKQIEFSLTSKVNGGPVLANGTLFWPFKIKLKGSSEKLATDALQPFFKNGPSLKALLGESLTTNFQAAFSKDNLSLQLKTISSYLSLEAILSIKQGQFELLEPASFSWTLTPDGYTSLMQWQGRKSPITLSEPAFLKGKINSLSFPKDIKYQGELTGDQLAFGPNKITHLQAQFDHESPTSAYRFQAQAAALPSGQLSCNGNWSSSGTVDIHLLLDQFPTATFDLLTSPFQQDPTSLSSLFGPAINLKLETTLNQWSGPIKMDLSSSNLRSSLQGSLTQGVLTLSQPFHLLFNLTPTLSKLLFQKVIPLSISSVTSEGPITLEISPKEFSYPIIPPNPTQLQIGRGRLELGKLHCKNEGNLKTTLGLLKLGQYRSGDTLKLWFAPLDFQAKNGIFSGERTEILVADSLQVCLWGKINYPKETVDAILGLTASCLRKAFNIKGLPDNYVLQIPIKGPLSDPQIDKGSATGKIAALLIWEQRGKAAGIAKGPAGALLGELLNKIGPLPGGDQKAPPAKKPFPWQVDQQDKKPSRKKKVSNLHRKMIHPNDPALKQALKLLR